MAQKNIFLYQKLTNQNSLNVNNLNITSLTPNTILQSDTNDNIISLANGTANQILAIDSTTGFPQYKTLATILNLNGLLPGNLFVDTSGNFFSEAKTYAFFNSAATFTTQVIVTQFYANVTVNRYYKVTVSFTNIITGGGYNFYGLEINNTGVTSYATYAQQSLENIIWVFKATNTTATPFALTGTHFTGGTGSNGTAGQITFLVEPLGY